MSFQPPDPGPLPAPQGPIPLARDGARTNGFSIASLTLGIIAWVFSPFAVPSILAVTFGLVARDQIRSAKGAERGAAMALVGIVFGLIQIVFFLFALMVLGSAYGGAH